jgi:hypothetical protein
MLQGLSLVLYLFCARNPVIHGRRACKLGYTEGSQMAALALDTSWPERALWLLGSVPTLEKSEGFSCFTDEHFYFHS